MSTSLFKSFIRKFNIRVTNKIDRREHEEACNSCFSADGSSISLYTGLFKPRAGASARGKIPVAIGTAADKRALLIDGFVRRPNLARV